MRYVCVNSISTITTRKSAASTVQNISIIHNLKVCLYQKAPFDNKIQSPWATYNNCWGLSKLSPLSVSYQTQSIVFRVLFLNLYLALFCGFSIYWFPFLQSFCHLLTVYGATGLPIMCYTRHICFILFLPILVIPKIFPLYFSALFAVSVSAQLLASVLSIQTPLPIELAD